MTRHWVLRGKEAVPEDDVRAWAKMFEDVAGRKVAETKVGDATVSTVFLGLDHSFGDGPPLLFESLVFGGKHDKEMRRYTTWDEAEHGHAELVAMVTSDE